MTYRETMHSEEGFTAQEQAEYEEWLDCLDDDGQPDEYTEWQDYMGGDDWDHGQYDEVW